MRFRDIHPALAFFYHGLLLGITVTGSSSDALLGLETRLAWAWAPGMVSMR